MGRNKKSDGDSGHTSKPRKISTKSRGCQTKISGEIQPRKKVKDKNAPKKPTSAYLFFQKERRVTLKEEEPTLSNTEQMTRMGQEWSKLSAEDKEHFEKLAAEDRLRYDQEISEYKKTQGIEDKKGKKRGSTVKDTRETKKAKTEPAPKEEVEEEEAGEAEAEGEGNADEAHESWEDDFLGDQ
eukprot:CAMPEP_0114993280 /NCGR_PEP_ID=MMETSP0216-20121206/12437_1 /TAXON_ID=223996 /ORGANISM="Protocruzia adherens, Strain Boccale" /LENGTH=182 /DNA_ID=CAMNT_0002356895 /DNA_START=130 /DNA_END=678 /DNA_ORIENTATION=+